MRRELFDMLFEGFKTFRTNDMFYPDVYKRQILGLLPGKGNVEQGDIFFQGTSLLSLDPKQWKDLRGTETVSYTHLNSCLSMVCRYSQAFR